MGDNVLYLESDSLRNRSAHPNLEREVLTTARRQELESAAVRPTSNSSRGSHVLPANIMPLTQNPFDGICNRGVAGLKQQCRIAAAQALRGIQDV